MTDCTGCKHLYWVEAFLGSSPFRRAGLGVTDPAGTPSVDATTTKETT